MNKISKGKRINFYNVGIFKNDIKTNISFVDLINDINNIDWNKRVRPIKDNDSAMFPISIIDRQINKVTMGKFRTDYKPFIGDINDDNYRELDEEIVELSTFVYLRAERTMILEHNDNGLQRGTIEDYFNSFLPDEYYIKLTTILKSQDIELIHRTTQITSLSVGLNLDMYNQMRLRGQQEHIQLMGRELLDFLDSVNDASRELEAEETILEYKVAYKKDATLNIDVITRLLDDFNYEDESISKFEVNYRNIKMILWKKWI